MINEAEQYINNNSVKVLVSTVLVSSQELYFSLLSWSFLSSEFNLVSEDLVYLWVCHQQLVLTWAALELKCKSNAV